MEEVKQMYEDLLKEFAQKLEGATPGSEETYQTLKDLSTLNQMYLSVVREMSEAEKIEKTYQIDLMKINNDVQRVEENKEISKKQLINDKIKVAGDVVRTVLSAGASIFLTRKILKVEDEGIVKTKTLPILEKLANKN